MMLFPTPDYMQDPNTKEQLIAQQQQEIDDLNNQITQLNTQVTYYKILSLRASTRPDVAKSVAKVVLDLAAKDDIDPDLLLALIRMESYFEPRAISWSGARGLTQVLPGYWKDECGLTKRNMYDVEVNVACGVHVLMTYYQKYGNVYLALTAYRWGDQAVDYVLAHNGRMDYSYARGVRFYYQQLKAFDGQSKGPKPKIGF
jgi:soluble lytic murein transglycosylase-like protein